MCEGIFCILGSFRSFDSESVFDARPAQKELDEENDYVEKESHNQQIDDQDRAVRNEKEQETLEGIRQIVPSLTEGIRQLLTEGVGLA